MFYNKFTKKDSVAEEIAKIIEENPSKHPDEKEDVAMVKKMVKSDCLKKESWDDDEEDDDVRRADAELKRMKAKPIEADKKTDPDKEIGKLAKKTPKEVDESVEQIDELSKDTLTSYIGKASKSADKSYALAGSAASRGKSRDTKQFMKHAEKFGKRKSGIDVAKKKLSNEETEVNEDKWTDIADGPWKKSNRSKSSAASAAANAAGKGLKGAQHKLDVAEPKGKLTGADFKKLRKEDAEQIDELSKKTLANYMRANTKRMADPKNPDSMERKMKRHDDYFKAADKFHKEDAELQEKTLTPAESKKKEEIVKSMKKGASGFKERYGKRAKEVMYATATKQAKKVAEEVESIHEKVKVKVSTDKPIGYKVSDIGPGKKEYNVKTDKAWDDEQKKKKTVSEAQGPTSTYGVDPNFVPPANTTSSPVLARAKELARGAMKRLNDSMMGKAGATSEEIDPSVKTTDTLVGRVKGGKDDDVGPKADGKSTKVKYTPGPK